jgi:hypothetical protein
MNQAMVAWRIREYNSGMTKDLDQDLDPLSHSGPLSHHARYIIGAGPERAALLAELEKNQGLRVRGNPDLWDRTYATFTIDDARELKAAAGTKPIASADGKKIFVLAMDGITVEAQNALLKSLEEPPEYAHFFIVIPSAHLLLPTVKSRMAFLQGDFLQGEKRRREKAFGSRGFEANAREDESAKAAEAFLKMPVAKRLETIKALMDDVSKEKKTKQRKPSGSSMPWKPPCMTRRMEKAGSRNMPKRFRPSRSLARI